MSENLIAKPTTGLEIELLANGVDTGYRDRNGTPIRVGDSVVYYKRAVRQLDTREEMRDYPKEYIVGTGNKGYVYTGKVSRRRHTVSFSFANGLEILSGGRYKYLYETDSKGNLRTILVDNEYKAPKLKFEDLIGG